MVRNALQNIFNGKQKFFKYYNVLNLRNVTVMGKIHHNYYYSDM